MFKYIRANTPTFAKDWNQVLFSEKSLKGIKNTDNVNDRGWQIVISLVISAGSLLGTCWKNNSVEMNNSDVFKSCTSNFS